MFIETNKLNYHKTYLIYLFFSLSVYRIIIVHVINSINLKLYLTALKFSTIVIHLIVFYGIYFLGQKSISYKVALNKCIVYIENITKDSSQKTIGVQRYCYET